MATAYMTSALQFVLGNSSCGHLCCDTMYWCSRALENHYLNLANTFWNRLL